MCEESTRTHTHAKLMLRTRTRTHIQDSPTTSLGLLARLGGATTSKMDSDFGNARGSPA